VDKEPHGWMVQRGRFLPEQALEVTRLNPE